MRSDHVAHCIACVHVGRDADDGGGTRQLVGTPSWRLYLEENLAVERIAGAE